MLFPHPWLSKIKIYHVSNFSPCFRRIPGSFFKANRNRTLTDIRTDGFRAVRAMIKTYDNLDQEAKRALQSVAAKLLSEGFQSIRQERAEQRSRNKERAGDAAETGGEI